MAMLAAHVSAWLIAEVMHTLAARLAYLCSRYTAGMQAVAWLLPMWTFHTEPWRGKPPR